MFKIEKIVKIFGLFIMIFAFLLNPWIIEYFFSPDKKFDFVWKYFVISSIDLVIFLVGFLTYKLSRNHAKNLLVFCIASFLSLIVSYLVILAYVYKNSTIIYFLEDEDLGWIVNPALNPKSLGFNEVDLRLEESSMDNIVYLIGDSFTYGVNIDYKNIFATIVDQKLSEINFINLGVPAYNPYQYNLMVKKYSDIKKPRGLVINFFVGNDLSFFEENKENMLSLFYEEDLIKPTDKNLNLAKVFKISKEIFHFFILANRMPIYSLEDYITAESVFFKKDYSLREQQSVKENFLALEDIIQFSSDNNIDLVVVLHPSFIQVHQEVFNNYLNNTNQNLENFEVLKPQRIIREFLEERETVYIDLTPYFIEVGRKQKLYLDVDQHYNKEGHNLAAEVITTKFKEINFVGINE